MSQTTLSVRPHGPCHSNEPEKHVRHYLGFGEEKEMDTLVQSCG